MKLEKVDFYARTIKDFSYLPNGSGIHVDKESDKFYYGTWTSMLGTDRIKVPKDICVKIEN